MLNAIVRSWSVQVLLDLLLLLMCSARAGVVRVTVFAVHLADDVGLGRPDGELLAKHGIRLKIDLTLHALGHSCSVNLDRLHHLGLLHVSGPQAQLS